MKFIRLRIVRLNNDHIDADNDEGDFDVDTSPGREIIINTDDILYCEPATRRYTFRDKTIYKPGCYLKYAYTLLVGKHDKIKSCDIYESMEEIWGMLNGS